MHRDLPLLWKPSCLKTEFHGGSVVVFFLASLFVLVVLSCFLPFEVLWYFSPITLSAAICFMLFYWFFLLGNRQGATEILPIKARKCKDEHWRVKEAWLDSESEIFIDIDSLEMQCFQMDNSKNNWNVDEQDTAAEHRAMELLVLEGNHNKVKECSGDEDNMSYLADSLAEGLWNLYFGKYSRWHYKENDQPD